MSQQERINELTQNLKDGGAPGIRDKANDVYELMAKILKDPLPHVDSCWQGNDPGRQWFPESVTFSDS